MLGIEGGWTLGGVPVRTLSPEEVRSHIDWRGERVPTRTLGSEGGWIVRFHIGWRGERNIVYNLLLNILNTLPYPIIYIYMPFFVHA